MRLLVIRRTEYKPLGHVKASAGGIAPKQRPLLYQGKTGGLTLFECYYQPTGERDRRPRIRRVEDKQDKRDKRDS